MGNRRGRVSAPTHGRFPPFGWSFPGPAPRACKEGTRKWTERAEIQPCCRGADKWRLARHGLTVPPQDGITDILQRRVRPERHSRLGGEARSQGPVEALLLCGFVDWA